MRKREKNNTDGKFARESKQRWVEGHLTVYFLHIVDFMLSPPPLDFFLAKKGGDLTRTIFWGQFRIELHYFNGGRGGMGDLP